MGFQELNFHVSILRDQGRKKQSNAILPGCIINWCIIIIVILCYSCNVAWQHLCSWKKECGPIRGLQAPVLLLTCCTLYCHLKKHILRPPCLLILWRQGGRNWCLLLSCLRSISVCHNFTLNFLRYNCCFCNFPHIKLNSTNQFSDKLISFHMRPLQNFGFLALTVIAKAWQLEYINLTFLQETF